MEETHTSEKYICNILNIFLNKIIYEPLEKTKEILKLSSRIILCITIIVIIPFLILITGICYFGFLFIKKNYNKYEQLVELIKNVKCNNTSNYMNYGYWNKDNMNLYKANKKLCKQIFKKGELDKVETILDVGCGYGEQDFYWKKKTNAKINAIDINKKSIKKANKINTDENIIFETGNACKLNFKNDSFDRVVNLESGFHYNPRQEFLKESYRVLKKGGKLVVADILYNEDNIDIFNVLNRNAFGKVFDIPECNKISITKFKEQLKKIGYSVKIEDITDKTFKPYYSYFFNNIECPDNFILPKWIFNIMRISCGFYINTICDGTNGFKYIIAVCEKN